MNLALAILGRAAPQLNIMSVAFPLQIGMGLLTFAGSLAIVVHAISDWTPGFGSTLEAFARASRVAGPVLAPVMGPVVGAR
jgi:flagellar biosynthetic protein FliR